MDVVFFSPNHAAADLSLHRQRLSDFIAPYLKQAPCLPLEIKKEHIRQVLARAEELVSAKNGFSLQTGRSALLAALYHDIGRFPQYTRWKTFSDAHSENHGSLGVRILKEKGFLDDEPEAVRQLVLVAVGLHNAYKLPPDLDPKAALVTHTVRDADKIDIFRVLSRHFNEAVPSNEVVLHVRNEPDRWSPQVAETILSGEVPSYTDLKYINDFRMLLASWLRDLHFADSRRILANSGYVEIVLSGLPDAQELKPVLSCLHALLEAAKHSDASHAV